MARNPKTISVDEVAELTGYHPGSVRTWLQGYRFTQFEIIVRTTRGNYHRAYQATNEFFNTLYSYLVDKNNLDGAEQLKAKLNEKGMTVEYCGIYKTN